MSKKNKIKKAVKAAVIAGIGSSIMSGLDRKASIATNEAKEAGFAATGKKPTYITKKSKTELPLKKPDNSFMGKVKKAVNVYKEKGLNTGRGPGIKKTDSLAGDYGINTFSTADGMPQGSKAGRMIKARGGKLVNLKPTKLY
jgi:hypothetical protein